MRSGAQGSFVRVLPAPRQLWRYAKALHIADLERIDIETLIMHGRDDRVVDPLGSRNLHQHLRNSQLHVFSNGGHWTMIEEAVRFRSQLHAFLAEARCIARTPPPAAYQRLRPLAMAVEPEADGIG
jgi:2-hydroxymuconate-semialdehyde hydrolase